MPGYWVPCRRLFALFSYISPPTVCFIFSLQIEVTYPDGSPADGVRVRVKAELTPKDNVYTSELISKSGQATFEIPSIPTAAQYVWLEVSGSKLRSNEPGENAKVIFKQNFLCLVWRRPRWCPLRARQ